MCQAREDTNGDGVTRTGTGYRGEPEGDEMQPYFIDGGGEGEPIQQFLGSDPFGNWVALARDRRIELIDTRSHTVRDVSTPDLDHEPDPNAGVIRTLQFSPSGSELVLLKRHAGDADVFIMSLYDGKTRAIDFGEGRVWLTAFSDDGRWLYAHVTRKDPNRAGVTDLPGPIPEDSYPCEKPRSYSSHDFPPSSANFDNVVVPLGGGPMRDAGGIQGHLEGDLVRRLGDGTLVREAPNGSRKVLAPAWCSGNLDYYSVEHGRWLVGCYAPDERPTVGGYFLPKPSHLWLFGRGVPEGGKDLGIEVKNGVVEGEFVTDRFSYLETLEGIVYFDLKRNVAILQPDGMAFCGRHGDVFMLETDDGETRKTYLWDPNSLPKLIAEGACATFGHEHMRIGNAVFSWERKTIVGDLAPLCADDACAAVDFETALDSGHVLLPQTHEPGADLPGLEATLRTSLARIGAYGLAGTGPLAWKTWAARRPGSRKKSAPAKTAQSEEPSRSCEILKASVSVETSAGPFGPLLPQGGEPLENYVDYLDPDGRSACDDAYGGRCPEIGLVTAPLGEGTWEAMYRMTLDLAAAPREKSPLGGMLVDSPLRKEHGMTMAAFHAWGDGRLYGTTATDLAKVSLGWRGSAKADGTLLALRGFVGWLNGIAEARGDARRFAWVEGYPKGVVIMMPDDLCTLTRAGVVRATVAPRE
jgi:hypothetical protein